MNIFSEINYDNLIMSRKNIVKEIKNNNPKYNYVKFNNIISNSLCDYIINESEKYALLNKNETNKDGWTRTRHKNYPTTDLPIREIPTLSVLVNNIIRYDIYPLIEKSFDVNKYFLDCNDIFIVKYEDTKQSKLERHKDGCAFSFNILLNSENDFEGGGTIICENEKDILVHNTKGGLILHSGQVFHSGNIITKGIRYILVGFIGYLKGYDSKSNDYIIDNKYNCNLESWQIDMDKNDLSNLNYFIENNKINGTYLLNTNKINYNMIEKFIYDLSCYHLERLNLKKDFNRYKIEFWWKNDTIINNNIIHGLHSDKDEILMRSKNILISPILSTITYINNSIYPTLIMNTPQIIMKQKNQINLKNGIYLLFPKELKHISFDGSYLHGVYNIYEKTFYEAKIDNRKTLMFNIWDSHTPLLKKYYFNNGIESLLNFNINKNLSNNYIKKYMLNINEMKDFIDIIINNPIKINNIFNEKLEEKNNTLIDIIEFDI